MESRIGQRDAATELLHDAMDASVSEIHAIVDELVIISKAITRSFLSITILVVVVVAAAAAVVSSSSSMVTTTQQQQQYAAQTPAGRPGRPAARGQVGQAAGRPAAGVRACGWVCGQAGR